MRPLSAFGILGLIVATAALGQQQVVLTSMKDNTLYQTVDGSTSNGSGTYMFVGQTNGSSVRRALVRFDVSSIPAGSVVTSVSLRLSMSKTVSGAQTISLHRLTADWGEAGSDAGDNEGSGAAAQTGDATWLHRTFNTVNWGTAGGDHAAGASAGLSVDAPGMYTWTSTTQLVSDVQGWVNSSATNFGWMLKGNEATAKTTKRFDTREHLTADNRPQLTVQYTTSTSVGDDSPFPTSVVLEGNYPNPFNPSTQIRFSLPSTMPARLSIYNLLGITVATLIDGPMTAGSHTATWDASGLPSGLYFARLEAGGASSMKRMVLAK